MQTLTSQHRKELELKANDVRKGIIRSLLAAGSGHSAGSLDMADVFTALYFHMMRHDPKRPDWEERDRLLLSCGHIAPVRYSAMAYAGYFPVEELLTLRKFGSRLQGHPERTRLPALETTSGPLGEGLAQGTGMALAAKMDKKDWRVYVVTSDGEHQCGLHWEAVMTAAKFKLDNLTCIVDRNFIQIDGSTEDVMPLEPFADKYRAFNWEVFECDGNDIGEFIGRSTKRKARERQAAGHHRQYVPGKGVSLYGRRLPLARQAAERRASRSGLARTGRAGEKIAVAVAERNVIEQDQVAECIWSTTAIPRTRARSDS